MSATDLPHGRTWLELGHRALGSRWALVAALILAVGLRLGHLVALRSTIYFDNLDLDPGVFDLWGQEIARGDWLGTKVFFVDPLYPYFLGGLYKLFGRDLLLLRLVQLGLGVTTCLLTALLGRALFGAAVGNLAGFIMAAYKPAIFNEGEVEKSVLAAFCLSLALVLLFKPTRQPGSLSPAGERVGERADPSQWQRFLAGVFFGFAALSRANVLVMVPVAVVLLLLERPTATARAGLAHLRSAGALAAGFLLVLTPVVWRNHEIGGEWVVTTSAGQNFYLGNNPLNPDGVYGLLPFVRATPRFEETDFRSAAEQHVGHALTPSEVSSFWFGEAWNHIRTSPAFAAGVIGRKIRLLLNDRELPDNQDLYFLARDSLVLRLWLPTFGWLLPLGLLGVVVSFRNRQARGLAALLGVYAASILAFFVQARFRIPVMPVLAVFAAAGFAWLLEAFAERRWRWAALATAAVTGLTVYTFWLPAGANHAANLAMNLLNRAALYDRLGQVDKAIEGLQEAVSVYPLSDTVHYNLGATYARAGRFAEAEQAFRMCLRLNPRHPAARQSVQRLEQMRQAPQ